MQAFWVCARDETDLRWGDGHVALPSNLVYSQFIRDALQDSGAVPDVDPTASAPVYTRRLRDVHERVVAVILVRPHGIEGILSPLDK